MQKSKEQYLATYYNDLGDPILERVFHSSDYYNASRAAKRLARTLADCACMVFRAPDGAWYNYQVNKGLPHV